MIYGPWSAFGWLRRILFLAAIIYQWNANTTWSDFLSYCAAWHFCLLPITALVGAILKGDPIWEHSETAIILAFFCLINLGFFLFAWGENYSGITSVIAMLLNAVISMQLSEDWLVWYDPSE